jgi:hypothetical protein
MTPRTLAAYILKPIAAVLVCSGGLVTLAAFGACVLTLVKPATLEPVLVSRLDFLTELAPPLGLSTWIVSCVALVCLARLLPPADSKLRPWLTFMGVAWMLSMAVGAWFSSYNSFHFQAGHWDISSRFRGWHAVSVTDARRLMWLNLRGTSSLVMGASSTLMIAGVALFAVLRRLPGCKPTDPPPRP